MKINKASIIVLIVGKSGSGKDTLVREVINPNLKLPYSKYGVHGVTLYGVNDNDRLEAIETDLSQVISYTNRPRREGENDTHIFTNDLMPDPSKLVAWTTYHGYNYWATKEQLKENDMYIIDPAGVDYLLENNDFTGLGNKMPLVIYLETHWWTRLIRITKRNNLLYAIKRLWNDRKTFKHAKDKADIITNNNSGHQLCTNRELIMQLFYPGTFLI